MNIYRPISEIMTTDLVSVKMTALMSQVEKIFDNKSFHHIPVIDDNHLPVGIISRHDYYQLQHHFTKNGWEMADVKNQRLFESFTVDEVMTPNPVTLDKDEPLFDVLDVFLANKIHSIIVTDAGLCVGIITPYDFLKEMKNMAVVTQS